MEQNNFLKILDGTLPIDLIIDKNGKSINIKKIDLSKKYFIEIKIIDKKRILVFWE